MPIKLTVDSFLAGVRQSGLIDDSRLDEALRSLRESGDLAEAEPIAAVLVEHRLLTRWQADKLLQGKFKGFVLGRYRLLELLGRGEMSTVYLAEHVRMKRRCAIKVLPASKARDTSYLGRFLREAEAVAALDHPNIVRAYDVDMEMEAGTEIHFLAMEYVEGKDLEKLLAERRTSSARRPKVWPTPMRTASFTATSNRATCWWTARGRSSYWTSVWPAFSAPTRGSP
jgi:serine/threonine-protein kinase